MRNLIALVFAFAACGGDGLAECPAVDSLPVCAAPVEVLEDCHAKLDGLPCYRGAVPEMRCAFTVGAYAGPVQPKNTVLVDDCALCGCR